MGKIKSHHDSSENPSPAADENGEGEVKEIEVSDEAAEYVRQLQAQRDEAVDGRLRALADFKNYQRRALENEQRAHRAGEIRMVRAILPVLDNFDLTLTQKPDQMTVQQLLGAVRIVRDELNKALQAQGVQRIEPAAGEAFDPHRHEAVLRQPAENLPPDSVVATLQTGYAVGDQVLRPAKVSVSPGAEQE